MQTDKRNLVRISRASLIPSNINSHHYEAPVDKKKKKIIIATEKLDSEAATLTFCSLIFEVCSHRLSSADVRGTEISKSHVRAPLLHHLLFGPTLSGGVKSGRGGAKEETICHPPFVTVLHQNPSSQPPLVIPGVDWAMAKVWDQSNQHKHKGKFGQSGGFALSSWHA